MSKFNFRLQKILDHRETVENVNKGKYGTAKRMLEQELEKLENIEEMKNFLNKEKENIVEKTTTIESLKIYNSCLTDIAEKIKVQNKKIEEAEHVVEKTRYELIESTKEKKIMEKLKVRDYHEYIYEQKKEEEKINDQFVSYSSSTNITGD